MSDDKDFKELIIKGIDELKTAQSKTTECLTDLTTEFKLHKQESTQRWDAIQKLDAEQNELLAEHSARSHAIQKDVKLREEALRNELYGDKGLEPRIAQLEEPAKISKAVKDKIKSAVGWISSVGGAAIIILKLLGYL